jgi:hypothetical protein
MQAWEGIGASTGVTTAQKNEVIPMESFRTKSEGYPRLKEDLSSPSESDLDFWPPNGVSHIGCILAVFFE